jgi:arylsulfatase
MSPVIRVIRLAAPVLIAASVAAQKPANFSGRWTLVPESAAATGVARSAPAIGTGWGSEVSIEQDAATLTIEFATYARYDMQPPTRLVYRLDGTESRNTINVGRGPQEQVSTAAWDGTKLTLTTVREFTDASHDKPMQMRTSQTLSLESPDRLVVETTHGAALGGRPSTSRSIYKKN